MKILFVAAEGAPFSKTGGLGDVIGALPKSLVKSGEQVSVVLPYYDLTDAKFGNEVEDLFAFEINVGWRRQYVGVKHILLDGVDFYFIDNQYYFFRGHVYGDFDDGERFAYFQLAAVELMEKIDFIPDVLHVHDYHTAMIPFLVKEKYHWIQAHNHIKTVLTIHNLEFQGQFPDSMLWELFGVGYERYADGTLRWNNCLNWMKAGILYADRVTTVSPSYAHEIMTAEFGCHLDQVLRMESGKLVGIVNGIDTDVYNPKTDKLLAYHFDKTDLSGKIESKRALQEKVGLPIRDDVPVVGIVSRLTRQKGFQLAAVELMEKIDFIPDVLHVHDYHTAMIPFLVKEKYHWIQAHNHIKTVLTIHNLEFQGQFPDSMLWELFGVGYERYADGTLRWNNCLNWMKAGILYADRVTTVSPSYAHEIMTAEFGCHLDQVLRMESGKLVGIVNGIDTDVYNPKTDKLLAYHFDKTDLSGKIESKRALQEKVGLPIRDDVPVVGIVSRLTRQKGFDLVVEELHNFLQEDVQIILLGTGDLSFEQAFTWFAQAYPEKLSANILFDITLAQEIYAASDIFLMPSRFEPCGLSQMMSMRYGTLPLVHEVGGLRDTVEPYNAYTEQGTGFSFNNFSGYWLTWTFKEALKVYFNEKETWHALQMHAMEKDFSWDTASQASSDLYQSLV